MIHFDGVSKQYREGFFGARVQALTDLNLQVAPGEVFGFLGPNGAGKSTAIKTLINLIFPDSGRAYILGCDVRDREVRRQVGYLPENPYFYDYLTARELLWFGGKASEMAGKEITERTEQILEQVGLSFAADRKLRTYSKGMVQRAGLALALIHDPQVVILDEPMSGLDPVGRKIVGDQILELKNRGRTVFFSSHILTDVERFCDRVGIIVGGRLTLTGSLPDLLKGGQSLEEIFLAEVEKAGGGRVL
jgi:ABC-2 type transport system ATP-binding protein